MKLVILDRDGVINEHSSEYVKTPEEWIPIPGSLEAIAKLYQAGWRIFVASNQSAVGRGLITLETLSEIHRKMDDMLEEFGAHVEGLFFCPHAPSACCLCRKPQPGLLKDLAQRLRIELSDVPFIGDTRKDVDAAKAAGAKPLLVLTGQGEKTLQEKDFPSEVPVYDNLAAAAAALLSEG